MAKYGVYFKNNGGLVDIPENGKVRGDNVPPLTIDTDSLDFAESLVDKYGKNMCNIIFYSNSNDDNKIVPDKSSTEDDNKIVPSTEYDKSKKNKNK